MKVGFTLLLLAILSVAVLADDPPATEGFEHKSGEDVLINLQGENHDFWIVSFFQPGDNYEEVRKQIEDTLKKELPDEKYTYGEVNLASGYDYQKLFDTLELVGEPKRGKTTPQVLLMKDGEGYVLYGPQIGDGIVKKFKEVKDGKVFK